MKTNSRVFALSFALSHLLKCVFYSLFIILVIGRNEAFAQPESTTTKHSLIIDVTPSTSSSTSTLSTVSANSNKNGNEETNASASNASSSLPHPPPQPSCPRVSLKAIIEQLQRNRNMSMCMLTNTVVQETQELPQINYASRECLAKVISANEEAVKTSALLDDKDNDLYMRNPCEKAADKFLIVRLCDRIKPTLFEIANLEFFSSAPKNIRVSVSKTYPTSEWILLGEYEMQNRREIQRFLIPDEFEHYVRFLKLELLTHYGKEYYCTLSFIRVYGIPGKLEKDESNLVSVPPLSDENAVQRHFNGTGDLSTNANTAAIFIEFGKRLTNLEANFKHYGQVIQSIRLLRNETRYLNQENSVLRRHVFGLQRDRDAQKRMLNRIKIENRRLRQEVKELREYLNRSNETLLSVPEPPNGDSFESGENEPELSA